MKGNFTAKTALSLLADPQIRTSGAKLEALKTTAIAQLRLIRKLESESALRAVLAGLALHQVKGSLPYGEFGPWLEKDFDALARRQVSYYMRLALACLEHGRFSKQDLLALAGDGSTMELGDTGPAAARMFAKIERFVGESSLNELLIEHGIKSGGVSGTSATAALSRMALAADDNTLLADLAEWRLNLRKSLVDPNTIKRVPPAALKQLYAAMHGDLQDFAALLKQMGIST